MRDIGALDCEGVNVATDGSSVNAIAIALAIAAVANPLDPAPVCLANFLNSMGWLQRNR